MPEQSTPLPLPGLKRIWSVRIADNIQSPSVQIRLMLRGSTIIEVANKAMKLEKAEKFALQYPDAEVVEVQYGGILES